MRRIGQVSVWLAAIALLYVASYPPYMRLSYGADPPPPDPNEWCTLYFRSDEWENETRHVAYAPVEWLIDETPAARALFWWAEVCGAAHKTRYDAFMRHADGTP